MEFGDSYRMFVNWWANVVEPTDVKLYIGTPVYRINEWNDERAISKQMYYNGTTSELVAKSTVMSYTIIPVWRPVDSLPGEWA